VAKLVLAEGSLLDRVLNLRWQRDDKGLSRVAYGQWHRSQMKTRWGSHSQRVVVLVEGEALLASAERYDLAGVLDGRPVGVCGIGSLWSDDQGVEHARDLIDRCVDAAAAAGAELALLFSPAADLAARAEWQMVDRTEVTLSVIETPRPGAPMTLVRGGEERDLAAIVAMGRVRAEPFRFHLDRDIDFVQHVITTRRLLAGLAPPRARQMHFFIAEEGVTAAAYVIVKVVGSTWTLEEFGDRDPSGARVGALIQALIAREPAERRPTIQAWLPPRFMPPQLVVASTYPSPPPMSVRPCGPRSGATHLFSEDMLYWRTDIL
jgi:hypothetical protein